MSTGTDHRPTKSGQLTIALLTSASLVLSSASPYPTNVALAETDKLAQERDAANARADEAAANKNDAANRAEQAESQKNSANATAESTQMKLEEANARLDELFAQVEIAYAELSKSIYELDVVRGQIQELEERIAETEARLQEKQKELNGQVSTSYKLGPVHWLEIVLDSTSFDEFITRVTYANKVTEQFNNIITDVKNLRAELTAEREELAQKEAEQEELVAINEQKAAAAEEAEAAQAAFVNSLSAELKAAIEAARAAEAEAAKARAEEAQFAAAEQQARSEAAEQQRRIDAEEARKAEEARRAQEAAAAAAAAADSDDGDSGDSYASAVAPYVASAASGDQRTTAVNAALSQVGLPYIWGTEAPGVGFDCNSLTHWAWSVAGVSIPYPSGHYMYGQFQWLKASGHWVYSESDLQPGDLVFYSNDGGASTFHVAMYIGGGQVVHAHSYRLGVTVTSIDAVNGFCGGGSPI